MTGSKVAQQLKIVARRLWGRAGDSLLALGLFITGLACYLRTLAPSAAALFDDTLEFPLVVHRLAIAHPTGYPLYILLGKLLSLAALGNPAWAVNLLSAIAAALTVALVYLAGRQLTRRQLPPLLGALALACSPIFWSQAVVAEVYTLNSAFVAALLWLALRWARQPLLPDTPAPPAAAPPDIAETAAPDTAETIAPAAASPDVAETVAPAAAPSDIAETIAPAALPDQPPDQPADLSLPVEQPAASPPVARAAGRLSALYRRFFPAVPAGERLRLHPLILVGTALFGLSLTHHRTVLLLAPPLLLFALLVEWRIFSRAALLGPHHSDWPRWRQIVLPLCLLAPLFLYLYLPIRGHVGSLDGTYANTWAGFWRWVTASSYGAFFGANPLARDLNALDYVNIFHHQFGPIGLALAFLGLLALIIRSWPHPSESRDGQKPRPITFVSFVSFAVKHPKRSLSALLLTALSFLAYLAFAVLYRVPDVEVFLIPAFLLAAIWIGVGLDWAADLLRPRGASLGLRRLLAAAGLLLFLAALAQPLLTAAQHAPDLDHSQRWIVHDYGRYLLQQPLPGRSTVVGLQGEMTLLRYLQEVEGLRPNLDTTTADLEPARRQAVQTALAEGQAVYLTRPLPGLEADHSLSAVTGLIDVAGQAEALLQVGQPSYQLPGIPYPVDLKPVRGLRLIGYDLVEHRAHDQAWAQLRLWWRAPNGLSQRLKVSARLANADGQTVAAVDAEPVANAYPTTAWRPGEIVADAYEIPLPAGLPPGDYTPLVVVYEPGTGLELGRAELAPVTLQGNPARPPRQALKTSVSRITRALFGDVELLGFTPPGPQAAYRPGDLLPVVLLWQAPHQPQGDLRLAFWLEAGQSYPLGEEPLGGPFPTGRWSAGQAVRQWPTLHVPDGAPPGAYRLKLRLLRDGQPAAWGRWLIPLGSDLDLGPVHIQ